MIVLLLILNIKTPFFKQIQDYTVYIMFGFLFLGLIAYIYNKERYILQFFACAGILGIFLKSASNSDLKAPERNTSVKISAAHINVSSVDGSYAGLIGKLKNSDLDVVSFQEVLPNWSTLLKNNLKESFPYSAENVRIDLYGMAVYSKFPIVNLDTLIHNEIPILVVELMVEGTKQARIINAYMPPSFNSQMDQLQEAQLNFLRSYLGAEPESDLIMGDFNMVYWSRRIREFRNATNLENSRRDVSQSLLAVPYDHIFHTKDLQCLNFRDLIDSTGNRLGIYGQYQFELNNI